MFSGRTRLGFIASRRREGIRVDFHKIAVLNGHFLPVREVRLDPTSAGIHSGWGICTTVRIYEGLPFNLEAHIQRLTKDAGQMGIPLQEAFENLEVDLFDLARRNSLKGGIGRIILLGGVAGRYSRFTGSNLSTADLLILTQDLKPRPPGESLHTAPFRLHTRRPLAGIKATSNLTYVQCRREALKKQYDDDLIQNESDHVVEVSTGNLFWVRDGELFTPSLETSCIDGSTRNILIHLARENGIKVTEGAFPLSELLAAQEAFVTSVSREVSPVVRINEHSFPEVPGPVSASLQESFQAMLETWVEETRLKSPEEDAE